MSQIFEDFVRKLRSGDGYLVRLNNARAIQELAEASAHVEGATELIAKQRSGIVQLREALDQRCSELDIELSLSEAEKLTEIGSRSMLEFLPNGPSAKKIEKKLGRPKKETTVDYERSILVEAFRMVLTDGAKEEVQSDGYFSDKAIIKALRNLANLDWFVALVPDVLEYFGPMTTEATVVKSVSKGNTARKAVVAKLPRNTE